MSSASRVVGIPELVLHCLAKLEPSRYDDASVKALVSCLLVSRGLREVARSDSLWLAHYRTRYTRMWKDEGASEEWNKRYAARRLVDLHVLSLLNTIITTPSKRGASIVEINKLGDGAWHVLSSEAACAVPPQLRNVCAKGDRKWKCERWESIVDQWDDSEFAQTDEETYGREVREDWIQRRWWAKQALGTMARASAVQKMAQVFRGPQPDPSTTENAEAFEEGLKAFSGLMGVNTAGISRNYDLLASTCARDLGSNGICVDPLSGEFDLEAFSAGVCAWMASKGFKRAAEGQYYNLMNHFPHTFMTTNRATLPMSLVCTFVAIVTRLGLRSSPVGFPGHVHAWIALPHPEPSSGVEDNQPPRQLAVDVFHYARQPFLTPEEMRLKLVSLGVPEGQQRTLMGPAVASEMILRAANNILHSVTRVHDQVNTSLSPETRGAALYAAAVAFLIARPEAADATQFIGGVISVVKEQCPLDTEPVLAQALSQVLGQDSFQAVVVHLHMAVDRLRKSEARIVAKRRTEGNVRWWAGLVFRHAKFHYTGVILGWDYKCMAGEEWIRDVGVDTLPRGRDQPFYQIMGADGSSRYVAEENIIPLPALATEIGPAYKVDWEVIRALMQEASSSIEPVFSRVEVNEELGRAWFVPSFVRTEVNPQSYTLVSLNGADTLRCHNISSSTLSALRESFGNETRFFGEVGDGDVAEFVFRSNPWSTKTVRSEVLIVHLFSVLLQHQYTFLTAIDYGRQYLDKLSLTFTRPASTPSNTPATESVFALSFIAPTVLRVLNAPLHATPAILQSVRGAWPRGVKSERKLGDGCWEFRLKGFGYFSTEKSDEAVLPHVFGLLRTFDTHAFKLIAAVPIGGRSRSKDLWLFTAPGTSKPSPSNQGTTSPSPYQQTLESDTAYSPGPFTASPTVGTGHGKFATDEPEKNLPIAAAHSRSASAPGPHRKPVPMPVSVVAQPVPPVTNPPMTMPVPMHVAPHPSTPPRNKLSTPPRTKPSTPPRTKPSTPPGAKPPSPLSSSQPAPVPVPIPPKRNSSLLRKFRASSGGAGRTASGRFRHPPPPPALAPNGTGSHARNGSLASGEIIYETPKPGQGQEPVQVPESPLAQTPLTPLAPVPASPQNGSPTSPVSPGFVAPPPPPPLPNASPVQDAYPSPVESRPTNPSTEELLLSRGAFRDSAFSGSTDTSHDVDILWTGTAPLVKAPAEQLADVKEGEEEVERSPDLVRTMHEDARPKSERAEVALAVPASEIPPVPKLDQERPGMPVPSQSGTPNEWVFVSVDKPKTTGTDSSASSPPPKVDPETPMLEPETPATAISRTGSFRRWFGSTQKSTTSKKGKPKRRRGMTPAIRSSKRLTIE